jgi:uncharacterized Zn-finger protein
MKKDLARHLLKHKENPINHYPCSQCERKYKNSNALHAHIKLAHEGYRWTCPYCPMEFLSITGRKLHIHKNHLQPEIPVKCQFCPKTFPSEVILSRHHYACHTFKIYQCDQCEVTFKFQSGWKLHMNRKHGGNKFVCNFCDRVFNHRLSIRQHMIIHTNEKNYKCPVPGCSKDFCQNSALRAHAEKLHPNYELPPKGTIMNMKALAGIESKQQHINSLVKIKNL